jgi:hypothetical protein
MWNSGRRSIFEGSQSVRIKVKYLIAPLFLAMVFVCTAAVISVHAQTAPGPVASTTKFVALVTEPVPAVPVLASTITDGAAARPATSDVISYDAVQIVRNGKPDSREFTLFPSQEHPVCSIEDRLDRTWVLYYCGHSTAWAQSRERVQSVYVYAGVKQYKTHHRVTGLTWWAANVLAIGAGVADIEVTQWDLRHGVPGREGNPLMGKTRAQAYAVTGGLEMLSVLSSIHRKRATMINSEVGIEKSAGWWNRMPWWSPYAGQIAVHAVGIASGFAAR